MQLTAKPGPLKRTVSHVTCLLELANSSVIANGNDVLTRALILVMVCDWTISTGMCFTSTSCCQPGKQCKKVPRCPGLRARCLQDSLSCWMQDMAVPHIPVVLVVYPKVSVHVCSSQGVGAVLVAGIYSPRRILIEHLHYQVHTESNAPKWRQLLQRLWWAEYWPACPYSAC